MKRDAAVTGGGVTSKQRPTRRSLLWTITHVIPTVVPAAVGN